MEQKKRGCYYVYMEYSLPEGLHSEHIITLNQHGAIVDMQVGRQSVKFQCPSKVFTETELAEIIKKERGKRVDLPPPFTNYKTRFLRSGCLYLYIEYNSPDMRKNHMLFTIDQYGELMEFYRSQP